jgi:hypothetical protein
MAEAKHATERKQEARKPAASEKMPPAGPHAKPELTDKDKTPRSGVLPGPDEKETEAPTG